MLSPQINWQDQFRFLFFQKLQRKSSHYTLQTIPLKYWEMDVLFSPNQIPNQSIIVDLTNLYLFGHCHGSPPNHT